MTPRLFATGSLLVLLATIAGCQMAGRGPVRVVTTQPTGVEGSWVDTEGVGISNFSGGRFETIAADTGSRLSEGSYRYVDNRTVAIELRSLIRQTVTNVNCALATPTQLNCTSSDGNRFVLLRRVGMS